MATDDRRIVGEARINAYLRDYLRRLKLDVSMQEVEPDRCNLIAEFSPWRAKRTVVLGPHTDTVSVANMTIDPFGAKIRGGRLYGRGACDTKGPMAAMLWALKQFVSSTAVRASKTRILFVGLMGEESGNDGARALMKQGLRANFAIAAEPTELNIVHSHKGALWFRLITRGKTAHGSIPQSGKNAIYKMSHAVDYLSSAYASSLAKKGNPALGCATVNVGVIRGGQQINIVADRCEIEVDRRTLPSESHPRILADLRRALAKRGISAQTEIVRDCRPLWTRPNHPMLRQLLVATQGILPRARCVGAPWFCDAAIFAEHRIPSVAFGPGNIAQAHTANEYIELAQLERGAQVFLEFLRKVAA
jgi:acetylornithine deacetylase/succinyl-diaminopimelate desuccinylase family protein